jgi:integrase
MASFVWLASMVGVESVAVVDGQDFQLLILPMASRVLAPACEDAGVAWADFHTFRHTAASRLFDEERNIVKVQQASGAAAWRT